MLVQDLMSTDVVTVPYGATLREAVERLLDNEVGSVVVMQDGTPSGMITETDVLLMAYRTDKPLSELSADDLSHRAVFTTKPGTTVQQVARQMAQQNVKKVPVTQDLELVGIITLTDIVWHLSAIRREASELSDAKQQWSPHEE